MHSVDCCFSFLRSLTSSRRNSAAAAALVLALSLSLSLFARAAAAETAEAPAPAQPRAATAAPGARARPARTDSLHRAKAFMVMVRSAAVPGWGQLYNRKYLKAGVAIGGEGVLAFLAPNALRKTNSSLGRP